LNHQQQIGINKHEGWQSAQNKDNSLDYNNAFRKKTTILRNSHVSSRRSPVFLWSEKRSLNTIAVTVSGSNNTPSHAAAGGHCKHEHSSEKVILVNKLTL